MGKRRQSCSASPVSTKATALLPPTIPPWRNAQSPTITTYRLENKVFTAGAFCWLRLNCAVMVLEKHFTKTLSSGQPLGQPLMTRWFPGFLGLKPTHSTLLARFPKCMISQKLCKTVPGYFPVWQKLLRQQKSNLCNDSAKCVSFSYPDHCCPFILINRKSNA